MASSSSLRSSATSLPHLLASLPKNGQAALVRPVDWPETSFYRITRTKLKFRSPQSPTSAPSVGSASSSTASPDSQGELGILKAYGKAWGMRYHNGSYQKPLSAMAKPDEEIRKGLKLRWVRVDPTSLPTRTQAELGKAAEVLSEGSERREGLIQERREAKRSRTADSAGSVSAS